MAIYTNRLYYNFITKLLVSRGYNSILVVYDKFSKILHFIVTMELILAKELVRVFRNNIKVVYVARESDFRQRFTACSIINKEVE